MADERAGPRTGSRGQAALDWSALIAPPRPPRSARGDATRRALVDVARRRMAEQGVGSVSLRHVILAAGVANESAVHYHFGSREGLVVAILLERSALERERARMLEGLRDGEPVPLRRAVEVLALPVAAAMATQEDRDYIRIAAQVVRDLPLEARVAPDEPTVRTALGLIAAAIADVPQPFRSARVGSALTLATELWAARAAAIEHGIASDLDAAGFEENLVEMLVGMLTAPVEAREDGDREGGPAAPALSAPPA